MSRQPSDHKWAKPPAGTASSRDEVCERCGLKKSQAEGLNCDGPDRDIVMETVHEYDPLA